MELNTHNINAQNIDKDLLRKIVIINIISGITVLSASFSSGFMQLLLLTFEVALFLWVFINPKFKPHHVLAMYIFLTPWEEKIVIFEAVPIVTLLKIFLVTALILDAFKKARRLKIIDIILLLFLILYGSVNLVLPQAGFSGLSIACDLILATCIWSSLKTVNTQRAYWSNIFLALFISTCFAMLYGFIQYFTGSLALYYIGDGDLVSRLRGVMGTDRSGMYLCISLIYPLYYIKKKTIKYASIIFLLICLILTLSMTAYASLLTFITLKLIIEKASGLKDIFKRITAVIIFIITLSFVWINNTNITFIDNAVNRFKKVILNISTNNLDKATSGRTKILDEYTEVLNEFSIFNKIFGSGYTNLYGEFSMTHYAHNSFLDLLTYVGVFGVGVLSIYILYTIIRIQDSKLRFQIFLFKTMIIITGLSVSALTSNYWVILLFL